MPKAWLAAVGVAVMGSTWMSVPATGQVSGATVRAEPRAALLLTRAGRPLTPRLTTSVIGSVWTADNDAVPEAGVRLRDLVTGDIAAATIANANGDFVLEDLDAGSYLVEVTEGADLVAVGEVINLAAGETIATFVKLPPAGAEDGFDAVGAAVVGAAAAAGLWGFAGGHPVSGEGRQ